METTFSPDPECIKHTLLRKEAYEQMYAESIQNPAKFWLEQADAFYWREPPSPEPHHVLSFNFDMNSGPIFIRAFAGSKTNIVYNCVDRHVLAGHSDQVAFFWEGNAPGDTRQITYAQLLRLVCSYGALLKSLGVAKHDRVLIYMPMTIEVVAAVLAIARIGAVHSVVFAGFSVESLAERLIDCGAKVLITADGNWRGLKLIRLKQIVDAALKLVESNGHHFVEHCLVLRHVSPRQPAAPHLNQQPEKEEAATPRPYYEFGPVDMNAGRDAWLDEAVEQFLEAECEVEWMEPEDPLFLLYTSGSTGKPKGVLHTCAGYMMFVGLTCKFSFDLHEPGLVFWTTADVGWITGHSYVIYGPLLNRTTNVIFEGIPTHPTPDRFFSIIDRYRVSRFYTAPTALRLLQKYDVCGDATRHSLDSLRVLGTVGEPINPSAWLWYFQRVGKSRCPIVDTFWQTETGGHVIVPLPGATPTLQPGSAGRPMFGVRPRILLAQGGGGGGGGAAEQQEAQIGEEGHLVFEGAWPGMLRSVYGDHARFERTYFHKFPGFYTTGDGARRDETGSYWITGRIDDMINTSGHLLSTAEIESALVSHPLVVEAAVVGKPHDIKGQQIYCFVTLAAASSSPAVAQELTAELALQLKQQVRSRIGAIATPDLIQLAPQLPKTRSGKIMRRILRQIALGAASGQAEQAGRESGDLGDLSTLADPSVISALIEQRDSAARLAAAMAKAATPPPSSLSSQ